MSNGRYKENSRRVREIYDIEANDHRYNIHHIIERSDYKRNKKFWDDSIPSGHFDLDGTGNLCPLLKTVHANLHRRLDEMHPPLPVKSKKHGKRKH